MASAQFFYTPAGILELTTDYETVSIGHAATVIEETHIQEADVISSYAGFVIQNNRVGRTQVRIAFEFIDSEATALALYNMETYLNNNGMVVFSGDATKTFAQLTATRPERGAAGVSGLIPGSIPWSSDTSVSANEVMVVESVTRTVTRYREYHTVDTHTAALRTMTFNENIVYAWDQIDAVKAIMVRNRDYYPALRLSGESRGQGIIRPIQHRNLYTFDATFDYVPHVFR